MEIIISIIGIIFLVWFLSHARRDDTDGKKRSDLVLYTDHGTGVQYVGTMFGAITPRLNPDGTLKTVQPLPSEAKAAAFEE